LKLNEVEIGRKVVYTPYKNCPAHLKEEGVVTGSNDRFVFVRYGSDYNSKATDVEDIEYIY
jgi:hypothetical protein